MRQVRARPGTGQHHGDLTQHPRPPSPPVRPATRAAPPRAPWSFAAHHGVAVVAEFGDRVAQHSPAGAATRRTPRFSVRPPGRRATPAGGPLAGRETLEAEPVRRQPGDRQRGGHRRRARQTGDRQPRRDAGRHQPVARVVDQRHPGVADHQHGGAGLTSSTGRARAASFWSNRLTTRPAIFTPATAPGCAPAGVLGGHHIGAGQRVDQPFRCVGGLTERVAPRISRPVVMTDSLRSLSMTTIADDVAPAAPRPRHQPGSAGAGRRLRAGGPAGGLGGDRDHHRAGRPDPLRQPRLADRCRHTDLRREALRAAGLAVAAQLRRRGQPGFRPGGSPATGQAVDRGG